jgi:hypothetical protein
MKERPILFSAPMVCAILDGHKSMTRRVAKIDRVDGHPQESRIKVATMRNGKRFWLNSQADHPAHINQACPYGQPGDQLWVRETHLAFDENRVHYRANYEIDPVGDKENGIVWTPSIHMPRWASRISLEITGVRVERLQEISGADAIAEGIDLSTVPDYVFGYQEAYRDLWESINGPGSWDVNPWVWVIEFRRVI